MKEQITKLKSGNSLIFDAENEEYRLSLSPANSYQYVAVSAIYDLENVLALLSIADFTVTTEKASAFATIKVNNFGENERSVTFDVKVIATENGFNSTVDSCHEGKYEPSAEDAKKRDDIAKVILNSINTSIERIGKIGAKLKITKETYDNMLNEENALNSETKEKAE